MTVITMVLPEPVLVTEVEFSGVGVEQEDEITKANGSPLTDGIETPEIVMFCPDAV